jgi:HK97 family phage major capsid protein
MKQSPAISLISEQTLWSDCRLLLSKGVFTHQDSARVSGLLNLAQQVGPNGGTEDRSGQSREERNVAAFIRTGSTPTEARDMGIASGPGGAFLVAAGFRDQLAETMRQYDSLFDPDFITWYPTPTGAPTAVPASDDAMNSATVVTEGSGPDTERDPVLQQVASPAPPTYRTGKVTVSHELLQDSAFDIVAYLSGIFAKRLARGISRTWLRHCRLALPPW